MKQIKIYTDGSCLNNPGFGGWAYILRYKEHEKIGFGAKENTTNNQMELLAIIEALKILKEPCEIELYTDSNLMVRSINEWLETWVKKDFKNKKNVDLWKEYLKFSKDHKIRAFWVKAHNGHIENEKCDKLAREAALNLQKEKNGKD
ncbi:ribonuclease HI [Campylobacter novaezeelandiae]|uniref:Ribonuclease H n=1 Tax=Campylobacter novaezeelandiae TaxID=2267891 RepID=A0A4Q9JUG6_9BACT|nr:ribonuclease HI [Campylobacter novaezeelandiae]MBK1963694.1 ribonuclease HI [Campylobacter novaezeelandiae]MBK1992958.1 ribonuclease HI [Campylobacter novaezeelandiae]QWU79790.1 ribonuclease HI [Campylobacter novaezeelandiae]TBR79412.1 ribonuclease HI [Campylobacter novaezeelandiae]TBR80546.1 ribonuclease HI [Campylobacter novaezeelandiae]